MRIIIDANILIAALIRDSTIRKILLEKDFNLYAPPFILEEVYEHSDEIRIKTGLNQNLLIKKIKEIFALSKIQIISSFEIKSFLKEAKEISPDRDDVEYVALALKMNCSIWSEDKELRKIQKVQIINTKELMSKLRNENQPGILPNL